MTPEEALLNEVALLPAPWVNMFQVNLCEGQWKIGKARDRATELFAASPAKLLLCGQKVSTAFGVPFTPFQKHGESLLILPHPSGLCRLWAEAGSFDRARAAVAGFLPGLAELIGRSARGR